MMDETVKLIKTKILTPFRNLAEFLSVECRKWDDATSIFTHAPQSTSII